MLPSPFKRGRVQRIDSQRLEEALLGAGEQLIRGRAARLDRVPMFEQVCVLQVVAVEVDDHRVERPPLARGVHDVVQCSLPFGGGVERALIELGEHLRLAAGDRPDRVPELTGLAAA
jgi:hypothetical protein